MKKILSSLLIGSSLLFTQPKIYADFEAKLFPNAPVERTIVADPDFYKTELKIPLEKTDDLTKEPIENIYREFSFAEELPLFSFNVKSEKILYAMPKTTDRKIILKQELSDKLISASVVGSGRIFSSEDKMDYSAKLEFFLGSPMIDDCLSDGNSIYLVGGIESKGSDFKKFSEKNLQQITKSFAEDYSFSADIYIVPKNLWSDQFLILRAGADNMGSNSEKLNVNFSTTFEFPSILGYKKFKNFKFSPYFSMYVEVLAQKRDAKILGQLGIKLFGESDKLLFIYTEAEHVTNNSMNFSSGMKINF